MWFSALGLVEYELGAVTTTTDFVPLSVDIDGPTYISSQGTYQWDADVAGGDGSYTYDRQYRTNHTTPTCTYSTDWTSGGTSSSMQLFVLVPGYKFQVRLVVSSDIEQKNDAILVGLSQYRECPEK